MDYSQFLLMKEELSLIAVIVILFIADLFMSPDAHKNDGKPVLNTMLPVALLTIRVILQWHQMPFYNRHSSRNHALSPYTSATAYFPATTFWCLPDIFTAHFETTNGTICNPRTTCKATPHELL